MKQTRLPSGIKIIDLSHDFRLNREGNDFIYGLPELNRNKIEVAERIANPGCFATAIQLAVLPLAAEGLLKEEIHVHAVTGSTGAGQAPSATTHYSWRNNNLSAYKMFTHQHLDEIYQSVRQLQPQFRKNINFIPVRGNHTRGIFVSAYTRFENTLEDAVRLYTSYYDTHPFVHLTETNPSLKQAVNTNKAILYLEKHENRLLILCVTDNLIKGASGQAVQNMNLMFDLEETTGLSLKPVAF